MSNEAVVTLNGRDRQIDAGSLFEATGGNDDIELLVSVPGSAFVSLFGGGGSDKFYGDGGLIYGGDGNDVIYSNGTPSWFHPVVPCQVYGGKGHDRILDHVGSTDSYGGAGNDVFSTVQESGGFAGLNHSFAGDVDRVWLGSGNDTGVARFDIVSDAQGTHLEDRLVVMDGGTGLDRLVLLASSLYGALDGDAAGRLDFTRASSGIMQLNNVRASGFEVFDLRITLGAVTSVMTGQYDDRIQIMGSVEAWFDGSHSYSVKAGAGNDRVIGLSDRCNERILGQDGDDVLISQGSIAGFRDSLDGGSGNDILVSTAGDMAHLNVRMRGGTGDDLFVIGRGYSANQVVADFAPGEDLIVFCSLRGLAQGIDTSAAAIRAGLRSGIDVGVMLDTADRLVFATGYYDRTDGELYAGSNGTGQWELIGRVIGAPDLTAADFAFL